MHEDREILFHRLDDPIASWSVPGLRWVVELWLPEMAYPVAQAWVTHVTSGKLSRAYVDWLYVREDHRRQGHGTALLKAILKRWPDAACDAATEDGEAFLDAFSMSREGRKRGWKRKPNAQV